MAAAEAGAEGRDWQRLDAWLWCARFLRSRADCAGLAAAGMLRINRQVTEKTHARLRVGDVLTLRLHGNVRVVRVVALAARRGPASEARGLYEEIAGPAEATAGNAAASCGNRHSAAYPAVEQAEPIPTAPARSPR